MFARIENNKVVELYPSSVDADSLHPDLTWIPVDDKFEGLRVSLFEHNDGAVTVNVDGLRSDKKVDLSWVREQEEFSGIDFEGVKIQTDKTSQLNISDLISKVQDGTLATVDYRAANGWLTIDANNAANLKSALANHVQNTWSKQRQIETALDALVTADDLIAYDVYDEFKLL